MATSKFIKFFQTSTYSPLTGASIWLVPQANAYPMGALVLTAHATRRGVYYRDATPDGEYSIYIDAAGGTSHSLYESNIWVGENKLSLMSANFDESGLYTIEATGDERGLMSAVDAARLQSEGCVWNRGTVTVNATAKTLTVSAECWYVCKDGRFFILQGGSGGGVITGFAYNANGLVNIIYVDVPKIGGTGTSVTLQKSACDTMPSVVSGYMRIVLGTSHTDGSIYIAGLTEKDGARRTTILENPIVAAGNITCKGSVVIDKSTSYLTASDDVYYTTIDGRLFTLQYGSNGRITNFLCCVTYSINLIYIDIPTSGGTGTLVELQKSAYNDLTAVASGYNRIFIGTAYKNLTTNLYAVWIMGMTEKDIERRTILAESSIVTHGSSIDTITTNAATNKKLTIGGNVLSDADTEMTAPNTWVPGIGNPTMDVDSTVKGEMCIAYSGSGSHQQIKMPSAMVIGESYRVWVKVRAGTGTPHIIRMGMFTSTAGYSSKWYDILPSTVKTEYYFILSDIEAADFSIGCLAANNTTAFSVMIDDVRIKRIAGDEPKGYVWQTDEFMQSLSKYDKTLTTIIVAGDSLMANGGAAEYSADDEGATMRPPRLIYNNFPRRLYDYIKFNPAIYRRIDHGDWLLSGAWTDTDGSEFLESTGNGGELFKYTTEANAYAQLTIPSGYENFAIILHRDDNEHGHNYDSAVAVTINGGSISSYGSASINTYRTKLDAADLGNPWYTELYGSLPSGDNVIRITKSNNTNTVMLWGIMYWTGNTIRVINAGHGGHTLGDLLDNGHLQAEVIENDPDAILLSLPLMNQTGRGLSTQATRDSLNRVISLLHGRCVAYMSCNIMGWNTNDEDAEEENYYETYSDPSMEQHAIQSRQTLWDSSKPFVDVFEFFRRKLINRGGTLLGGQAGLWWTLDGMHPNALGYAEWFNIIKNTLRCRIAD